MTYIVLHVVTHNDCVAYYTAHPNEIETIYSPTLLYPVPIRIPMVGPYHGMGLACLVVAVHAVTQQDLLLDRSTVGALHAI